MTSVIFFLIGVAVIRVAWSLASRGLSSGSAPSFGEES